MSSDLRKLERSERQKSGDAGSRLKWELLEDALGRMFGEEVEKTVPGAPRVVFALANHAHTGWDRAKALQRAMFNAAAGSGLEIKFAF
jgi:hypothetical protein